MSEVNEERLQAYFDGELSAEDSAEIEAQLVDNPELGERLQALQMMRELVVENLNQQASKVHEARFEQVWDAFDRKIAGEQRLQSAADSHPGLLQVAIALIKNFRVPMATAAAAAVAIFVMKSAQPTEAPHDTLAAAETKTLQEVAPAIAPVVPAPAPLALVVADPFERPISNNADIETIEFGGRSGTIAHIEGSRGTTTVIWVVEDEDTKESERSL